METIDKKQNNFNPADTTESSLSPAEVLEVTDRMKELVESLLKQAKPEEQAELKMLYNAMIDNANSYQADSTSSNLKDWREAKSELSVVVEKLQSNYDHSDQPDYGPAALDDIKSVLAYLLGRGYEISRSGIYKHHQEGKFSKDKKSGKFLLKKINKYAKDHVPMAATGKKASDETDVLHVRKLKAEIKEKEMRAAKAEKEVAILEGQYIERQEMERELVGRALVIDSEARHMIKTTIPQIVELVGGDASAIPQAIELQLAKLDKMMNTFASTADFVVDLQIVT